MANKIMIENLNQENIELVLDSKITRYEVRAGDKINIYDYVNKISIQIINSTDVEVVFDDGTIVIFENLAQLIQLNNLNDNAYTEVKFLEDTANINEVISQKFYSVNDFTDLVNIIESSSSAAEERTETTTASTVTDSLYYGGQFELVLNKEDLISLTNESTENLNTIGDVLNQLEEESLPQIDSTFSGDLNATLIGTDNLVYSGKIIIEDNNAADLFFQANILTNEYGTLEIDKLGNWTFTINEENAKALPDGDIINLGFDLYSVDGTKLNLNIELVGVNDTAELSTGNIQLVENDSILTSSGKLDIYDVDKNESEYIPEVTEGALGTFTIDKDGNWTFEAKSNFNILNNGDNINEIFTVKSLDGTKTTVTINISGTDDLNINEITADNLIDAALSVKALINGTDTKESTLTDAESTAQSAVMSSQFYLNQAQDKVDHYQNSLNDALIEKNNAEKALESLSSSSDTEALDIAQEKVDETSSLVDFLTVALANADAEKADADATLEAATNLQTEIENLTDAEVAADNTLAAQKAADAATAQAAANSAASTATAAQNSADTLQSTVETAKANALTAVQNDDSSTDTTAEDALTNALNDADSYINSAQAFLDASTASLNSANSAKDAAEVALKEAQDALESATSANENTDSEEQAVADAQATLTVAEQSVTDATTLRDNATVELANANSLKDEISKIGDSIDDISEISEGTSSIDGNLFENDTNVSTVSNSGDQDGSYGTITINEDGTYTYDLDNTLESVQGLSTGEQLTETFNYTTVDANGNEDTSTITINIKGTNDGPVAVDETGSISIDGSNTSNYLELDNAQDLLGGAKSLDIEMSFNSDGAMSGGKAIFSYASSNDNNEFLLFTNSNGTPSLYFAGKRITVSDENLLDGEQHDIKLSWDSATGELKFYVDGNEEHSSIVHKDYTFDNADAALNFGQEQDSIGGNFDSSQAFKGTYHDIKVSVDGQEKAHWDMSSSDGKVVDSVGNFDLSINGDVTSSGLLTNEDNSITIDVLANDTDVNGDEISIESFDPNVMLDGVVVGTVEKVIVDGKEQLKFTPNDELDGLDEGEIANLSFTYTITDGSLSDSATVNLSVMGTNDTPTISLDSTTDVTEESVSTDTVVANISSNDLDDNADLTYSVDSSLVEVDANGVVTLTQAGVDAINSDSGTDMTNFTFNVTVKDEHNESTTVPASIDITRVNENAPTISLDSKTDVTEESVDTTTVVANVSSSDVDDDANLTYSVDSNLVTVDASGVVTLTQAGVDAINSDSGTDMTNFTFNVIVTDENGVDTQTATTPVSIDVSRVNDNAPVINPIAQQSVNEGDASISGTITSVDLDDTSSITYSTTSNIAGFTLNNDGTYSFDPSNSEYDSLKNGEVETLTIPVTSTDGTFTSTEDLVIKVTGTNDAPIAEDDSSLSVNFDTNGKMVVENSPELELGKNNSDYTVSFSMKLEEDHTGAWRNIMHKGDADYDRSPALWMQPNTNKVHFRVSTDANANEGSDSQTEIALNEWTEISLVKDGNEFNLFINGELDQSFTLSGDTLGSDAPFSFGGDSWYSGFGGSLDNIQIHNRALSDDEVSNISNGDVISDDSLVAHYDFQGANPYADKSGNGNDGTIQGTVNTESKTLEIVEDNSITVDVLINDTDADGDVITIESVENPVMLNNVAVGTAEIVTVDGKQQVKFTPNDELDKLGEGESANISFTYTITDGSLTDSATVSLTVNGTNDAPTISLDSTTDVIEESVTTDTVVANVSSSDLDENADLTYSVDSNLVEVDANGVVTLTQAGVDAINSDSGTDMTNFTFNVTVKDEHNESATVPASIDVTRVNDSAPVIDPISQRAVNEGDSLIEGSITSSDLDDGSSATYSTSLTVPGFNLNSDGTYSFDPTNSAYDHLKEGATETITIPVTVSDGSLSDTENLVIKVTGTNDAPVAVTDTSSDLTIYSRDKVLIDVMQNDTDVDDDSSMTLVSAKIVDSSGTEITNKGDVSIVDGLVKFDPTSDFKSTLKYGESEDITLEYTVRDENGLESTVTSTVSVVGDFPTERATYNFDVSDGTTKINPSGTSPVLEKATLKSGAKIEDGVVKLDGKNDHVDLAWSNNYTDSPTMGSFMEKTVSISFKADDTNGTQVLYEEGATTRGMSIYIKNGNICVSSWNKSDAVRYNPVVVKTALPDDGEWHTITLSLDGGTNDVLTGNNSLGVNGTLEGFLDGESFGTKPAGGLGGHNGAEIGCSNSTFIDGKISSGAKNFFGGEIEHVSILGEAVDQETAEELHLASKGGGEIQNTSSNREYSGIVSKIVEDEIVPDENGLSDDLNLIGEMNFDESGDTTNGVVGKAETFNNESGIKMDVSGINTGANEVNTMTMWFKKDNANDYWDMLGGSNRFDITFCQDKLGFNTFNSDLTGIDASEFIGDGEWHQVTVVMVNGDVASNKIYIDGVDQGALTEYNGRTPNNNNSFANTDGDITIGNENGSNSGYGFSGGIDEVKVYKGEVSADDIQAIYELESEGFSASVQNVEKDVSELDSDTTLSSNDDKLTLSDDANTNDLSSISSTDFGDGIDTLIIEDDLIMDFESLAADAFKNLEVINMDNASDNALENLSASDVLASTDGNKIMKILGDSGDTIGLKDSNTENDNWIKKNEKVVSDDGETFDVWTNNDATVYIDEDVTVTDI